jgi:hypothetical protein
MFWTMPEITSIQNVKHVSMFWTVFMYWAFYSAVFY